MRVALARFGLVAGMAVVAAPFVGLAPAYACSCAAASEREHLAGADVVFKGTLVRRVAPADRDGMRSGGDPVTYVFAVARSYKGKAAERQRVRSPNSGAGCGIELSGKGPYLVFATKSAKKGDRALQAYLCGGTRPIGAKEEPDFAARKAPPKPAHEPAPAAKPPAPPDPDGEPLPSAPGAPVVPIVPVDPVAPAERDTIRAVNSLAVAAQDFANRLVGPLFPQ